ncbi:hypothetical protein [Bacillus toyonensis]|uniref:hypothetical protein n=1 Tax=Bacillus toyonensis TaxID=155322 RepID=UPI00027BEAAD|nr:hypothetical protein [Bacillus toyonensis]EJV41781.1 hypothetical protein IEA_05666 [Bacillus toyonensis]
MNIKQGDQVRVIKGFHIHGLKADTDYKVSFVSLSGTIYIWSNKGYNVPLEKGEWIKKESKKSLNRRIEDMERDVSESEFVPRLFKRNEKESDPKDSYFHTKGKIYIEVPPERYVEYDFGTEDVNKDDVVLYTDCEHTILVYYKREIDELFEEVK